VYLAFRFQIATQFKERRRTDKFPVLPDRVLGIPPGLITAAERCHACSIVFGGNERLILKLLPGQPWQRFVVNLAL
jgi:hypothetical protein